MSAPPVYFFLGAAGAGRREVAADLIVNGLARTDRPILVTTADDADLPETVQQRLQSHPEWRRATWHWADGEARRFAPLELGDATHVFFITDGRRDPVEQIEALHEWLPAAGVKLGRIIAVIHCRLGFEYPPLQRWHDACVHFADVVLLNRREGVPNKWIGDFKIRLTKEHYPCLVEFVKKNEVANPALVLEPQARRMSLYFDDAEQWPELDEEDEEETLEADAFDRDNRYLERLASGRRAHELPDIGKILNSES